MVHRCCVYQCHNNSRKKEFSFHRFPDKQAKPALHKKWLLGVKRKFVPNQNTRVCSEHFLSTDFEASQVLKAQYLSDYSFKRTLKNDSFPSVNVQTYNEEIPPKRHKPKHAENKAGMNLFGMKPKQSLPSSSAKDFAKRSGLRKKPIAAGSTDPVVAFECKTPPILSYSDLFPSASTCEIDVQCEMGSEIYRDASLLCREIQQYKCKI